MALRSTLSRCFRVLAIVLLTALLASACGGSGTATETASPEAATDAAPAETEAAPASSGSSGLSGQFDTIAGETVNLEDYEGQDVVLWFWAPW